MLFIIMIKEMKKWVREILCHFIFIQDYISFKQSISNQVTLKDYLLFKLRKDKRIYWPVHRNSEVTHPDNIYVGINSNIGTRPGCYIQGNGGIYIGNYVRIASNIGIISGNHDLYDHNKHVNKRVEIGDYTWVGMGAIIMPGVILGPRTIVGAGSIVTHSFPEGYCVIGGNPARLIKKLDKDKFIPTKYPTEYYGFIPKNKFKSFAKKHLKNNRIIQI